ncbi:phosphatidate cytidylyltransferase [Flavobacteriaceae bacterium]|nr:phosphatidate cytidylyltransferase [Flavobacteriaceae bacterium]
MVKRIISAFLMVIFVVIVALFYSKVFITSLFLVGFLIYCEWLKIISKKDFGCTWGWKIGGIVYVVAIVGSLLAIYQINQKIIFYLIIIVSMTDIFALVFGKLIGGPKLAPSISPNKTWSGFFGGLLISTIAGIIFIELTNVKIVFDYDIKFVILISIVISILAQCGDLFESRVKRLFDVKDSGTIIPGHGGVLDRLDGFIFTAPFLLIILKI